MCVSGRYSKNVAALAGLSEKDAAKVKTEQAAKTYTYANGQTVNALENNRKGNDRNVKYLTAYKKVMGVHASKADVNAWFKEQKQAYSKATGIKDRKGLKIENVVAWLEKNNARQGVRMPAAHATPEEGR
jgi:hypothetical protein